jgi:tetratricopeptide (TPR) repeat protein
MPVDLKSGESYYINREGEIQTEEEVLEDMLLKELVEATDNNSKAKLLLNLGQLKEKNDNYESAEEYYRMGVDLCTDNELVTYFLLNNIGYCLNELDRSSEAEVYLRNAIKYNPDIANAYKNLGISLEKQEKYKAAAESYLKGNSVNPEDKRCMRLYSELLKSHLEIT